MMNYYEWGVVEYLKWRELFFYRVDEIRQAVHPNSKIKLKNFDLIVPGEKKHLLVEIKGRKASGKKKLRFENWVTSEDISALLKWKELFGEDFESVFCFVYRLEPDSPPAKVAFSEYSDNNFRFAFLGFKLEDYIQNAKLRSVKWNTFSLISKDFLKFAHPFGNFLPERNSELNLSDIPKI